jgi:erythromycin esterase-like protein
MWRNADVLDFVSWVRDYNDQLPSGQRKVGSTAWTCTACTAQSARC